MYNIPKDVEKDLKKNFTLYKNYIDKIVIFGSRARGDYTPKLDFV